MVVQRRETFCDLLGGQQMCVTMRRLVLPNVY